jgi:hypothetical protein
MTRSTISGGRGVPLPHLEAQGGGASYERL